VIARPPLGAHNPVLRTLRNCHFRKFAQLWRLVFEG
jgi:hypothetical protein